MNRTFSVEEVEGLLTDPNVAQFSSPIIIPENGYGDIESLKFTVFSNPNFIKQWAYLAHYLGYGWCGGTKTPYVGEDFSVSKSGEQYIIQANYNPKDPYASGYRASERLRMTVSNVRLLLDPVSLSTKTPMIQQPQPIIVATTTATNNDPNNTNSISKQISYTESESTSTSTSSTISNSVKIGQTFTYKIGETGGETNFEYTFTSDLTWGSQKEQSSSKSVTDIVTVNVPPVSRVVITAVLFKSISDVPYTATAIIEYDMTLHNFLRYSDNAYEGHPTNRPTITYTFGSPTQAATAAVVDQYGHRNIPGYSKWDWNWMREKHGAGTIDYWVNQIGIPYGAQVSGKFNNIDSTNVVTETGAPIPITLVNEYVLDEENV